MNKKLIEYIKEEMHKLLEEKTGYGRNEVKSILEQAIANATLRLLDEV